MGCSQSIPDHSKQELAQNIMKNFSIAECMNQKFRFVAYSSKQLMEIVEAILSSINSIEEEVTEEEKSAVQQTLEECLSQSNKKLIMYSKAEEKLRKLLKGKCPRPESLSKIYYTIANIQKKEDLNIFSENEFNFKCWQTNSYCLLTTQQIEEVAKLQMIGQKVEQLGKKIFFKFDSIQKQSKDIFMLLIECFCLFQKEIDNLKYNFSTREINFISDLSMNACRFSDNGVVLLLIYFVRACQKMQSEGKSTSAIQRDLNQAISIIYKKFPPGEGLKEEDKHLKTALEGLTLNENFHYTNYKLQSKNKQLLLEDIIKENAKKAKQFRNDFEQLIQNTCFDLSIKVLTGIKLDPDYPNKKAMGRIKEKMLFKKQQIIKKKTKNTIKETIDGEEKQYTEQISKLLIEKTNIDFKISDMLRGKCVFGDVTDIIFTVDSIKAFILNDETKRFRIVEIQSRFTNKIPISDVTLKIAINEQILTELQLTVQSNAAAYNFSHKIYELQRTKTFSKIKIVHNYFEQFHKDFKERVSRAINLAQIENLNMKKEQLEQLSDLINKKQTKSQSMSFESQKFLIFKHKFSIQHYFNITDSKVKELNEIFKEELLNGKQQYWKFDRILDKNLQGMMMALFNKQMGSWESQLGKEINSVLQSQCSDLIKSTLLYYFFKSFNIFKEVQSLKQFHHLYKQETRKLKYKKPEIKKGKDFMEIYFQKQFGIITPFKFNQTTARLFYKAEQLQNIVIQRDSSKASQKLIVLQFVKGGVMEENSPQTIEFLMQLVNTYFLIRGSNNSLFPEFKIFYQWLIKLLKEKPNSNSGVECSVKLLQAISLLELCASESTDRRVQELMKLTKEAGEILQQVRIQFKEKEELLLWLECELFLVECMAYQPNTTISAFQNEYSKKVVKNAESLGLELRGKSVANSEWRIYHQLMKKQISQEEKTLIKTHLSKAITESSRIQGDQFIFKMQWAIENGYKLEEFNIMENKKIRYLNISKQQLLQSGLKGLSVTKWSNLSILRLRGNNIGLQGCKYLKRANWNLTSLMLYDDDIGPKGCEQLSSANWNLTCLKLYNNNINDKGCANIIHGKWKNLVILTLRQNKISDKGCQYLINCTWKNITNLDLRDNNISVQGCRQLIKGKWSLTSLNMEGNNIGIEGCKELSKAGWNLCYLDLSKTNVDNNLRSSIQSLFSNKSLTIRWQ